MSTLPHKNKIKKLEKFNKKNDNKINKKWNEQFPKNVESTFLKPPRILYDSGWLKTTYNSEIGNVVGPTELTPDSKVYGNLNFYATSTAQEQQEIPLQLDYNFMQDIQIPEDMIPFVKSTITLKKHPQAKVVSFFKYKPKEYDTRDYWLIKTGGYLVYKGYYPGGWYKSHQDLIDGNILYNNLSKWLSGEVTYTENGDTYRIVGTLMNLQIYYDTVYVPGADNYNYKYFSTQTYDTISNGVIAGQGNYREGEWVDVGGGNWAIVLTPTTTSDKEENKVVDALGTDNTANITIMGEKYKNGARQSGTSHSFKTVGNYNPGTATITNWNITYKYDENYNFVYKLYYSSRRLRQLQIDNYNLVNLPELDDWDVGNPKPFIQATVKINPEGYPIIIDGNNETQLFGNNNEVWGDLIPFTEEQEDYKKTPNENKYRYFFKGAVVLTTLALTNKGCDVHFADEIYTFQTDHYVLNELNRDDKQVPYWAPAQDVVEFRLTLTIQNELYIKSLNTMEKT